MSNRKRSSYIGSYDAGCILGVNPYRPRRLVWEEKVGDVQKDISNPHIDRGNTMEPIVEAWMKDHVDATINSPEMFELYDAEGKAGGDSISGTDNQIFMQHQQLDFVGGHPDGIGASCYYEFKCPTQRKVEWIGETLSPEMLDIGAEVCIEDVYKTGVPTYWLYQVQHGLMVTGLPRGELVIWDYDRWSPLRIQVPRDEKLIERMHLEYEIFWNDVQMGIEPQGDTQEEIEWCALVEDEELEKLFAAYIDGYAMRYKGKDLQSEYKAKILTALQGRQTVVTPNYTCNAAYVDRGSFGYYRLTIKDRDE